MIIAYVALAYNKLEWSKCLIHGTPLVYNSSIFVDHYLEDWEIVFSWGLTLEKLYAIVWWYHFFLSSCWSPTAFCREE